MAKYIYRKKGKKSASMATELARQKALTDAAIAKTSGVAQREAEAQALRDAEAAKGKAKKAGKAKSKVGVGAQQVLDDIQSVIGKEGADAMEALENLENKVKALDKASKKKRKQDEICDESVGDSLIFKNLVTQAL
jgi:hypothetical protein